MLSSIKLKFLLPISLIVVFGSSIAIIYADNLPSFFPFKTKTKKFTKTSEGFEYLVVSIVETTKKASALLTNDKPLYSCLISNNKRIAPLIEDLSCALYKFENFNKDGSQTVNIPLNLSPEKLLSTTDSLQSLRYLILKLNKRVYESLSDQYPTINIIDKSKPTIKYLTLNVQFPLKDPESTSLSSNLIQARLINKHKRQSAKLDINSNTKYLCQIKELNSDAQNPYLPCQLYTFANVHQKNNTNHNQLKELDHASSFNHQLFIGVYIVLDFFDHPLTFANISNKLIELYEVENDGSKSPLITASYDQHLFGKFSKQKDQQIFAQTPRKRVFLAKNTKKHQITQHSTHSNTEKNYRCIFEVPPTKYQLTNFDDSCSLFAVNQTNQETTSIQTSKLKFSSSNLITKLNNNKYFFIEFDANKLYNFDWKDSKIIKAEKNTSLIQTDQIPSFLELELIKEWDQSQEKFVGPYKQATPKASKKQP